MTPHQDGLPALPDADMTYERRPAGCEPERVPAYTADQMRAYALAALAAQPLPVQSSVQARAIDLHEKAGMPWTDAEQLALSEIGADDAAIDELIGESGGLDQFLLKPDELRQFARSILVHGSPLLAAQPKAQPATARKPLTDAEADKLYFDLNNKIPEIDSPHEMFVTLLRWIEAVHGIAATQEKP